MQANQLPPATETAAPIPTNAFGCFKNTIRTRSGRYLDLLDPQTHQIDFGDIAGGLSKICRFGGQIGTHFRPWEFYSVAEHCVHCAEQASADGLSLNHQRDALMHDASEAYIGDIVKPLKVLLPQYAELEERLMQRIEIKFFLSFRTTQAEVTEIDHAMLIAERKHFFTRDDVEWTGQKNVRTISPVLIGWHPSDAEKRFTEKARALGITR